MKEKLIQLLSLDDFENDVYASEKFINELQNDEANYISIISELAHDKQVFRNLTTAYIFSYVTPSKIIIEKIIEKCFESGDMCLQHSGISLLDIYGNIVDKNKFANYSFNDEYLDFRLRKVI